MATKINLRENNARLIYGENAPESSELFSVEKGDLRTDEQAGEIDGLFIRNAANSGWIRTNDFLWLKNVPTAFVPIAHGLASEYHFGMLNIVTHISGHTLVNRVHQQMMGLPLMFAL